VNGIPKPVWAVGFAHEQTLRDATLAVFSFANLKTASAEHRTHKKNRQTENNMNGCKFINRYKK
jgi:hypothetical protein